MNIHLDLVGQKENIVKIRYYLEVFSKTSVIPHLLLSGPKGVGKSKISREIAKNLAAIEKTRKNKKIFVEINGSSLKTVDELMNRVLIPYAGEKEFATIFIDEGHLIPPKITGFLLSLLSPNKNNYNDIQYGGNNFRMDFKRTSWIFATSEHHKMFEPLRDRMTQIELTNYSRSEIAQIIAMHIEPDIKIDSNTLEALAEVGRGNARNAYKLAMEGVNSYCIAKGKKTFNAQDLAALLKTLDIFPKGISRFEIGVLQTIGERDSSSLNCLCSKIGLSKPALQQTENYLVKNNLMEIDGKRKLTVEGRKYLQSIKSLL